MTGRGSYPNVDERAFQDEIDSIFEEIENGIDELDDDFDFESGGGVLTVTFPDGSSVIFSRQPANQEIWIAAKSGGFHLHKQSGTWFCAVTKESLSEIVHRVFEEQLGRPVSILAE